MKQNKKKYRSKLACLLLACNVSVQADILTDGTVGDIYYLFGDNMIIPESYGTRVGDNLFHSFSMFNIYSGEAVTFTGSNTLQNVIARVTGGDVSMINGILSSNIGKANFYFINPAGVTFGKNAVVDVPAAFHVSTANQINFADGSVYSATNPAASTLTIAKPESFGFVGQTGDIVLDGVQIVAKENQTIDLVANNITLKNNADLYAPAGEVRLVAAKGSQNVSLVRDENGFLPLPMQTPNGENAGNILLDNSKIDTTGNGGGRVTLWGGDILLKAQKYGDTFIFAGNNGFLNAESGKGINIRANLLSVDNSLIASQAFYSGNTGNVSINARNLDIFNSGVIGSITYSQGNAGSLFVNAYSLNIFNDGLLGSGTESSGNADSVIVNAKSLNIFNDGVLGSATKSSGNANSVTINAGSLNIFNGGSIGSTTISTGNAGNLIVNAGSLNIFNAGVIGSTTFSQGNAGSVSITASQLKIDGQGSPYFTGVTTQAASNSTGGNAGDLTISAESLDILNGGEISSGTFSQGNAGNLNITANRLKIDGQGGINSGTEGTGNASNVTIKADRLELLNGGWIDSSTDSQGRAGDVNVSAANINMNNGFIAARASAGSSGQTGNVTVTAMQALSLTNDSAITMQNNATITNPATIEATKLTVNAPSINLSNSSITTASSGNIKASNIKLNFSDQLLMDSSFVLTTANIGDGGSIDINGGGLIDLKDSGFLTSVSGDNSNGGNINVNTDVLVMDTGVIQANAEGGHGGDINLNVQVLIPSYNSLIIGGEQVPWQPYIPGFNVIQAASEAGVNGTVNVSSPQFDISGSISGLKTKGLEPPTMSRSPCNLGGSSLKRKGKGGFPRNEKKYGFIPPVTQLPTSINDETETESQNTPTSESQKPCAASVI